MRSFEYIIEKEYDGASAEGYLRGRWKYSSSLMHVLRQEGALLINGRAVYTTEKLHENDVLSVNISDSGAGRVEPSEIDFEILYEDKDILAVNKPSGMATHPSINHYSDTLANAVCYYYIGTDFKFRAVNRLDLHTSGAVLIAKNLYSALLLSDMIKKGEIYKEYTAVCEDNFKLSSGTVEANIKRDGGIIKRCISPDGKWAKSEYEKIGTNGKNALVRLVPITGRTHQLRLHMAHIGCPILGDFLYGSEKSAERMMLHCNLLEFIHPVSKENIRIKAPIPPLFYRMCE